MLKGEGKPRSYTKDGRVVEMASGSVQDLIDAGVLFCGTPDLVYDQIADFVEHCGGMGNLLMMGTCGPDDARRHGGEPLDLREGGLSTAEGDAPTGFGGSRGAVGYK
jgi:alkanesulfonate monooxygenase SsuD/methylene tetrahydromethanopterin reductase-like flavin-dependent oxidoreductase (luciferase family)